MADAIPAGRPQKSKTPSNKGPEKLQGTPDTKKTVTERELSNGTIRTDYGRVDG